LGHACYKEGSRQLALVAFAGLQEALASQNCRLWHLGGVQFCAEHVAARGVDERKAMKRAISLRSNGLIVQAESDPRLVDLELAGLKHPATAECGRTLALSGRMLTP
jgi:hypothetical protein